MNQNSDEENLKRVDFKKGFFKKVKLFAVFNVYRSRGRNSKALLR